MLYIYINHIKLIFPKQYNKEKLSIRSLKDSLVIDLGPRNEPSIEDLRD